MGAVIAGKFFGAAPAEFAIVARGADFFLEDSSHAVDSGGSKTALDVIGIQCGGSLPEKFLGFTLPCS